MKKARRIFLLITVVLFAVVTTVEAQWVSLQRAQFTAEQWMMGVGEYKKIIEKTSLRDEGGNPIGYLFNFSNGGFVVVPIDDVFSPIKAWSKSGQFHGNPEVSMDIATMTLKDLDGQVKSLYIRRTEQGQSLQTNEAWDILEGQSLIETDDSSRGMVGPLLTTKWNQGFPYNQYCPLGDNGQLSLTGCVATAMAQILRYWGWPKTGSGNKCYNDQYVDSLGCGTDQYICADFSHEYRWDLMAGSYPWPDGHSASENDAVARLMADVGVLAKICYSPTGSSGFFAGFVTGLPVNFGYSEEIHDVLSVRGEFFPTIKEQLDKKWPVLFSSDRHAYVADGYWSVSGMDQVHFNFGWGGYSDGWFTVESFNSFWNWDDSKSVYVSMVVDIHPLDGPPSPPSLSVSVDDQTVSLNWSTFDADGYILYYSSHPFLDVEDSGVHSITFSKEQISLSVTLPSGVVYYVAVQGYNQYGYGELSEIKFIQVL